MEGVKCNEVQGAMYAFPRITLPQRAIEEAKVPVPPALVQLRMRKSAYETIKARLFTVSVTIFINRDFVLSILVRNIASAQSRSQGPLSSMKREGPGNEVGLS